MNQDKTISTGLAFIQAAAQAMPKTLGDRERIFGMCALMRQAIRLRFAFDKNDGAELRKLDIHTCVGVFRALDYYRDAVEVGGTYARMWETFHNQKAWVASRAMVKRPYYGDRDRDLELVENHRIAEGIPVLLPAPDGVDDGLAMFQGYQVWHCTSMSDTAVTLCRYSIPEDTQRFVGWQFRRIATPAKRLTLTREAWAELNPKVTAELKAA